MLPLFDTDRRRRQINLGGASSSTSHSSILDQAKLRREERIEQKRRTDSAVKVQAWWRGTKEQQRVRLELRRNLEEALDKGELLRLNTLRMLVVVNRKQTPDTTLSKWSRNIIQYGSGALDQCCFSRLSIELIYCSSDRVYDLFAPSNDAGQSYMVLLKQVLLLLLQEVARNAQ